MNSIEERLKPLEGFLISITRDTVNGWYKLQIGLPKDWIYRENDIISCEELSKSKEGTLIEVSPKKEGIIIDDLVDFVGLIMDTNSKIAEKEKEFTNKMNEVKEELEKKAKDFYGELEDLRQHSFQNFGKDKKEIPSPPPMPEGRTIKEGGPVTPPPPKKRGRGRPPGSKNKPKPPKAVEPRTISNEG